MVSKVNAVATKDKSTDRNLLSSKGEIDYLKIYETVLNEPMDIINAIRTGLPGNSVNAVGELLQVSKGEMYSLMHISTRTGQRVIRSGRLDVDKSNHLVQLMKIHIRCVEIFKDRDKAVRWLKTPNFALGDHTPLSLLDTTEGIELVADTLTRIEYGVFG